VAASIGMVLVARHSDRTGDRRRHVAFPAFAAAAALLIGALVQRHPVLAFLALCVSATGIWSTLGPFWSIPTAFLSGTAAAGGIALINSVGNVGGFVGPTIMGFLKERTHRFESGLLVLAATLAIAGVLLLVARGVRCRGPDPYRSFTQRSRNGNQARLNVRTGCLHLVVVEDDPLGISAPTRQADVVIPVAHLLPR
jgi:nitrate/nitrite transporter NarK